MLTAWKRRAQQRSMQQHIRRIVAWSVQLDRQRAFNALWVASHGDGLERDMSGNVLGVARMHLTLTHGRSRLDYTTGGVSASSDKRMATSHDTGIIHDAGDKRMPLPPVRKGKGAVGYRSCIERRKLLLKAI